MQKQKYTGLGMATQLANVSAFGTITDGITATGTVQADAYAILDDVTVFTTVAAGTGARLRRCDQVAPGDSFLISNFGANVLLLYPPVGAFLDNGSVNVPQSIAIGQSVQCVNRSLTQYIVMPTISGGGGGGGGTGTVTTVSVVTANGVSGSVANPTTTPAITLTLGAITPTSVNASGTVAGSNLSGTNTGDQTITLTGDVTGSGTGTFAATLGSNFKIRGVGATFGDTAGAALTAGSVVYFTCPFAGTIAAWNITVDAGTCTFDIWKIATGSAVPTVSNTITASALPAISSGTAIHSTTLTGWTTAVAANDIFGIQLKTVATAKYAELDIQINQ